ncbi:MAG: FAD-dependent protein, partial [Bdellovibrionota bacterium]
GGFVLSSGTSPDGIVANGMSNYHRNSPFANAAMVVSVDHEKRFGKDLFGGLKFRRSLEQAAFKAVASAGGSREIPVQGVVDFLEGRAGEVLKSSSPSGVKATRLDQLLPSDIVERIRASLEKFDHNMRGFITREAQFHGVESRTSCPVRVTRDTLSLQSTSHPGLYPTGEGAGYAGGITSAACDGIRVADAIAESMASRKLATASI